LNIAVLKIAEIKKMMNETDSLNEELIDALAQDARAGVREIYLRLIRMKSAGEEERCRLAALYSYEDELKAKGFSSVAGVDEVGRGPLAGPVVAAAVILPDRAELFHLNDSKKLTASRREALAREIQKTAIAWAIGLSTVEEINTINIHQAGLLAMKRAVLGLKESPSFVLADGFAIAELGLPQLPVIGGDAKSASIAAASIVAKVYRDMLMDDYHVSYPQYGFDRHKGYGTADHLQVLNDYGPCPIHRASYGPVRDALERRKGRGETSNLPSF